jgi:hypothetical protein
MTEPENEPIGSFAVGDDPSLILAVEIRRLLPVLKEIAGSLKDTSERLEAALSPSGYATSVFEALRLLNITIERIRVAGFDKLLTRREIEALEGMYPEGREKEK